MTLLIQVPNGGHETLAWISVHISLVYWCIHSALVKGSRTLFWRWWQRERLEHPGSVVTRGEGAQTKTHRCYVTSQQTGRALQSVTARNVLRIQKKTDIFIEKKCDYYCVELTEEAVEATQPVHCWCCPGVMKQRCKCELVEWAQLGFRLL